LGSVGTCGDFSAHGESLFEIGGSEAPPGSMADVQDINLFESAPDEIDDAIDMRLSVK
jgi:hypothetical protein